MKKIVRIPAFAFAISLVLLSACKFGSTDTNSNIDPATKSEIQKLNKKLFRILNKGDVAEFKKMAGAAMLESEKDSLDFLLADFKDQFKSMKFTVLDEFYQSNSTTHTDNFVIGSTNSDNNYKVTYQAVALESYVCVVYFDDKAGEKCFTLVYGKYGNDWKLNIMHGGVLTYEEKDAVDWYEEAQVNYKKGYIVDAALQLQISKSIAAPGGELWKYEGLKDIDTFEKKLLKTLSGKYQFPYTIEGLESKPEIISIFPEFYKEGIYPTVAYKTSFELNDTTHLHPEFDKLHAIIGKVFPGFDKNNKGVMYKAFYFVPEEGEEQPFYYCQKDF